MKIVKAYLSNEYYDYIKDAVQEHRTICIKGGTGIGKTECIAKLAIELKAIIAVPFIDLKINYIEDPSTKEIRMDVINDIKDYHGQACCMTYDRLSMIDSNVLEGKYIFLDETHVMFADRDYRDRLVKLMDKINNLTTSHITYVSATPKWETRNVERVLEFGKEREIVNYSTLKCKNVFNAINTYINNRKVEDDYQRVVVFSDNNTRRIYDSFPISIKGDMVTVLHREYEYTGDLEYVRKHRLLNKKITLCTSLANNGLNFNNEDELVLVISEVSKKTTAADVIQQVGRMRNSTVDLCLVYKETDDGNSVEDKKHIYDIKVQYGLDNGDIIGDEVWSALKEIESYNNEHSGIENIKKDLDLTGYFNCISEENLDNKSKTVNKLRRKADKICRKCFNEEREATEIELNDIMLKKYYEENMKHLKHLEDLFIDNEEIKRLNEIMYSTIHTFVTELNNIFFICNFSDEDWKRELEKYDLCLRDYKDDKVVYTAISADRKTNVNIRELYGDLNGDRNEIVKRYIQIKQEMYEKRKLSQANTGKVNGKNNTKRVVVKDNNTGRAIVFKSRVEAIAFIGCSNNTFDQIRKGKSKKYSHLIIK